MKRLLLTAILLATCLLGCTDEGSTRSTLQKAGFTNISVGGYSWFSCSEDDTTQTEFTATNPRGQRVSGTVCCGLVVKACTIRF